MTGVLIVDDEYAIVDALSGLLEDEGYSVATAANGAEAMERLSEKVPCVLLVDLMMPIMDGRELVRRIGEDPRYAGLPIILMSAVPQDIIERGGMIAFDAYLQKPFDVKRLLDTIAALAKKSEQDATG